MPRRSRAGRPTRRFIWNDRLLLLELDGDGDVLRKLTWGRDLSGSLDGAGGTLDTITSRQGQVGGLLAIQDTNGTTTGENPEADDDSFAFFYDTNGNVGQLVDTSDGSLDARYEYDAYGNVTFSDGAYASENKIRFSTKYWDDETGLGNWGYRYYDPRTGRWTSWDPIEELGGTNLYSYADGAPTQKVDPMGHDSYAPPASQPEDDAGTYDYKNPEGCCQKQPEIVTFYGDPDTLKCERRVTEKHGWIECCKGNVVVCLGTVGTRLSPPVKKCLVLHESSHAGHVPAGVCADKPEGAALGGKDEADRRASECSAFKEELKCLLQIDCNAVYPPKLDGKHDSNALARQKCKRDKGARRLNICQGLRNSDCDEKCPDLVKDGQWVGGEP